MRLFLTFRLNVELLSTVQFFFIFVTRMINITISRYGVKTVNFLEVADRK